MNNPHPTLSSAAASTHGAASPSLELLEARQLRDALKHLLRREQAAMADFLFALADFDRRRGWEPLGHASLFAFLHVELQLSRSATFWRYSAARLLQRFPQVIEPLRDGRLCLTTAAELAKVLTEQNLSAVLPRYFHLSAREAAEVTAELLPREQPPLRTVVSILAPEQHPVADATVTAVPADALILLPAPAEPSGDSRTLGPVLAPELLLTHPARVVTSRDDVEPLTADLRRLHITVSRQFLQELEMARNGLSHAIPNATTEQVLQEGLRLLLEKQARARGQVKKPRAVASAQPARAPMNLAETGTATSENPQRPQLPGGSSSVARPEDRAIRREGGRAAIPAAIRRAVWARDSGRCSWPLDGGATCGSTHRLEFDHIVPWADWGGETEANLRVTCAAHNRLAARRAFGERIMARYSGVRKAVAEYGTSANGGAPIRRTARRSSARPGPARRATAGSGGSRA
jgi:5-methylcytosine-specific restriction endonuclease McrA